VSCNVVLYRDARNAASVVSIQGGRSYQEDKYAAELQWRDDPQAGFFGVFDGHGGARCSEFIAEAIPQQLKVELAKHADPSIALRNTFLQVDQVFLTKANLNHFEDGSTAVTALIANGQVTVANAGDSRCVLASNRKAIALSSDHKPGMLSRVRASLHEKL
jgi:serine/threonine protein phosphatase PrpC